MNNFIRFSDINSSPNFFPLSIGESESLSPETNEAVRFRVETAIDREENAPTKPVEPVREESYELIFHNAEMPAFFLNLRDKKEVKESLRRPRRRQTGSFPVRKS